MKKNDWTQFVQLGLELSISVIFFFFIGIFLDNIFNLKPILTLIGSFLGIFSVFYILWKTFNKKQ